MTEDTSQFRAGRYIKQLEGYSAFIPAPLPPAPPIQLSISKRLVELTGRRMGLESEEGKGTFWFTIPFGKQAKHQGFPMRTRQSVRGSHILTVDDNATNRTILTKALVSFGCFPEEVESRREALSLLDRKMAEDRSSLRCHFAGPPDA